jgi:hypothetical protein
VINQAAEGARARYYGANATSGLGASAPFFKDAKSRDSN